MQKPAPFFADQIMNAPAEVSNWEQSDWYIKPQLWCILAGACALVASVFALIVG